MKTKRHLLAGGATLVLALAGLSIVQLPANAADLPSAATVLQNWNNAFLIRNGTGSYGGYGTAGTYYTDHLKSQNTERAGTWVAAYDVAVAEDDYLRTRSADSLALVNDLVTTQLKDDGTTWASWDGWNDDVAWMLNTTLRGYQITGNPLWLSVAKTQWDAVYSRGWDSAGGGGIWENMQPQYSKCVLSNDSLVFSAVTLYKITGDSSYLTKAVQIYKWVKDTLVESNGKVNECLAFPNGATGSGAFVQKSDNAYNAGLVIEAGDAIYRANGDNGYAADAQRTASYFMSAHPIVADGGGRGTNFQYWLFKGMKDLCVDIGTCADYQSYMTKNAAQAWSERNSLGLTWNDWLQPTNESNPDAFEMMGMVGLFEDLETNTTTPGPIPAPPIPSPAPVGTGPVRSGFADKCLDVRAGSTDNGAAVQLYDCNNTAGQNWTPSANSTLRVLGKCLDATANGTGNGTLLEIWDCNGGANQEWVSVNGGYKNPSSGRCIDDPGFFTTNGTQLELWDCNGGGNQVWW